MARAQRQERLEREMLIEKLEAVESQMQVQTTLEPSILFRKTFFGECFPSDKQFARKVFAITVAEE